MGNLLGLSHLTITTSDCPIPPILRKDYDSPSIIVFHQKELREKIDRYPREAVQIALYKNISGYLPAIEALQPGKDAQKRPDGSYGLLLSEALTSSYLQLYRCDTSRVIDEHNILPLVPDSRLTRYECPGGLWLWSSDLDREEMFHQNILEGEILEKEDSRLLVRHRVMTRKIPFFLFDYRIWPNEKREIFRNDDTGLSSIGWIVRDVFEMHESLMKFDAFNCSSIFSLEIGKVIWNVFFVVLPGGLISHEFLSIGGKHG